MNFNLKNDFGDEAQRLEQHYADGTNLRASS